MYVVLFAVKKSAKLFNFIEKHIPEPSLTWVSSKTNANPKELALAFVLASRKIGKEPLDLPELWLSIDKKWLLPEISSEQLVRAYFLALMSENAGNSEDYQKWMNDLFETAEMNEGVALYRFLLVSSNPEILLQRAKEAVRSNVGNIFDAIAFHNPFPFRFFEEAAWNQLILKCIFNDKPIHLIIGLDERRNPALAETLSDFAHERWAAGRRVPSQVWRLITPFINETLASDLQKLIQSSDERDQLAACLVIRESKAELVAKLQAQHIQLLHKFEGFNWSTLENNEPIYTGK